MSLLFFLCCKEYHDKLFEKEVLIKKIKAAVTCKNVPSSFSDVINAKHNAALEHVHFSV